MTEIENQHIGQWVIGDMYLCVTCGYNLPIDRIDSTECEYVGKKLTPSDKRFRAIGFVSKWLSYPDDAFLMECREGIELEIVDLRMLGRTARWIDACDAWLHLVQEADVKSIRWALGQGSIYAVHAA